MFKEIVFFEIKSHLRRPTPYVFFVALFLLSFLIILNDVAGSGLATGKIYRNAPSVLNDFIAFSSILGIVAVAALMGKAAYRDIEHGTQAFIFTLPFSKGAFLGGRFVGALIVVFGVFAGVGLGCYLATLMPWLDPDTVASFNPLVYVKSYGFFLLPNLFFVSCIFFALVAFTRKIVAAYIGAALLFAVYIVGLILSANLESEQLAALLDPFGDLATELATKYWTVSELNTQVIPITGTILLNRVVWGALGLLVLALTFLLFDARKMVRGAGKKARRPALSMRETAARLPHGSLPQAQCIFSWKSDVKQTLALGLLAFKNTVKDKVFISVLFAALIVLSLDAWFQGRPFGISTYPVTYEMLAIKDGIYVFFVYGILVFFSGELIWQERKAKFSLITDAFPIPNGLLYGAKFVALTLVCVLLVGAVLLVGLSMQTLKGYFHYEIGLYLKELLLITLPNYILVAVLCFFIHILVNNRFIGTFVALLFLVAILNLDQLGLGHPLYRYSVLPTYIYSDMNGYGHFVAGIFWFTLYWAFGAFVLVLLGNLLWSRGIETTFANRLRQATAQVKKPTKIGLLLAGGAFLLSGSYIFYNTEVLNKQHAATAEITNAQRVAYEKKYKRYEGLPQPSITAINIEADLYPEILKTNIRGTYILQNKSDAPIDSLHTHSSKYAIAGVNLSGEPAQPLLEDLANHYYLYALEPPLAPGDSMTFEFDLQYEQKGFSAFRENTDVVANGTFFNNTDLPSFGYDSTRELADNNVRKKHGLPYRSRFTPLNTPGALKNSIVSRDADWITFEAVLSTSEDQIAIAPGHLQKVWIDGGRNHYHYKTISPIHNFYPILSARYAVHKDVWRDVDIEIFYHKGHTYNLDRMVRSIKQSLTYYTENFGPYYHKHIRIVEFPRYMTNAQAFAGTIPYSEAVGFIAQVKAGDVDMPFYVTAHEVAHQWWGHQVVSANVQGAAMLSETLAQYSTLMVMEKEYGLAYMQRFLRFELNRYLTGRSAETEKELPLYRVEFQNYIHYAKGSLAMYALKDYLGEQPLNQAIRAYVDSVAFQEAPYTTTMEFLSFIKKATPDSLKPIIVDLFEKITLYENRVADAFYQALDNGSYEVTLTLHTKKLYADSLGVETETPMTDWVDVGIFTENEGDGKRQEVPVYFQKHRLQSDQNILTIRVDALPVRAGIDPYNKLIDRNPDDNMTTVRTN